MSNRSWRRKRMRKGIGEEDIGAGEGREWEKEI
jgi:hypothetical protein